MKKNSAHSILRHMHECQSSEQYHQHFRSSIAKTILDSYYVLRIGIFLPKEFIRKMFRYYMHWTEQNSNNNKIVAKVVFDLAKLSTIWLSIRPN